MRTIIFVGTGRVGRDTAGLLCDAASPGLDAAKRYAAQSRGFATKFASTFDHASRGHRALLNGEEGEHALAFFSDMPYSAEAVVAAARYPGTRVLVFFTEPTPPDQQGDAAMLSPDEALPSVNGKPQCFPVEYLDEILLHFAAPFRAT